LYNYKFKDNSTDLKNPAFVSGRCPMVEIQIRKTLFFCSLFDDRSVSITVL
jgi:hypothetical protein